MAKALRLRLNELRRVSQMEDLLYITGKWEALKEDRAGQWSGRLTKNWRIIAAPEDRTISVCIIEIVDYH
ncbi:type II toxin-antitoxin system YoeB family toxin [Glutamicibacter sp.]|uniref:type II toxin-antitoxin system YoeB family toxin n=1 Tax=Glutamicibacter sp. TaxID=1931995 RepID=UPI0028BDDBC8|nr:type II toxin-antitoxin system RelE/ParE family toxin [Glutamicibacter sp.]